MLFSPLISSFTLCVRLFCMVWVWNTAKCSKNKTQNTLARIILLKEYLFLFSLFLFLLSDPKRSIAWRSAVGGLSGFAAPPETLPLWGVDSLPRPYCPSKKRRRRRYSFAQLLTLTVPTNPPSRPSTHVRPPTLKQVLTARMSSLPQKCAHFARICFFQFLTTQTEPNCHCAK